MTDEQLDELRLAIGEAIPPEGSEADTHFTDEELTRVFDEVSGDMTAATARGWRLKAAIYAELVDMSELREEMKLGQLYEHAMKQVAYFQGLAVGGDEPAGPVTQVHKLAR